MVVSTYQAASGAGAAAMRELEQQTHEVPPLLHMSYLESGLVLIHCLCLNMNVLGMVVVF